MNGGLSANRSLTNILKLIGVVERSGVYGWFHALISACSVMRPQVEQAHAYEKKKLGENMKWVI